jgi:dimethylamine/trimethylamine dehydrogenase
MGSSRFTREGGLAEHMRYVRALTGKPVVTVGRFTSPDVMAAQLRDGITDLIGAARPSIADPFLPQKIREGRSEDIRECIGCNICYAHDSSGVPIRCTQNPTMGEEWRRGWHPEHVARDGAGSVLIVGAGPAGLEAAHILGKRGFAVALADALEPGGRVSRESRLPGLAEWARVRDYRLGQIARLPNVTLYCGSTMRAADVVEFGADHVVVATGSRWRRNGLGRDQRSPLAELELARVLTPDDIMDGARPQGDVVVFDDDHYYMGGVVAEHLARAGAAVRYVTSGNCVGEWSVKTAEQHYGQARLIEVGVQIVTGQLLRGFAAGTARFACRYTARETRCAADVLVLVTSREPQADLYHQLLAAGVHAGSVHTIGDCHHPALIASAVYAGHKIGRELGRAATAARRDRVLMPPAG